MVKASDDEEGRTSDAGEAYCTHLLKQQNEHPGFDAVLADVRRVQNGQHRHHCYGWWYYPAKVRAGDSQRTKRWAFGTRDDIVAFLNNGDLFRRYVELVTVATGGAASQPGRGAGGPMVHRGINLPAEDFRIQKGLIDMIHVASTCMERVPEGTLQQLHTLQTRHTATCKYLDGHPEVIQ